MSEKNTTARAFDIFKSGQKVTAWGLNCAIGFNDGRKAISTLRAQDIPIMDSRLPDRRKVYWLPIEWERIMEEKKRINPTLF
ncbi:MAG: hypothetical protein LBC84_06875 [Prevotellaceae bacterium]|jgi:hypothetical protein|nr:hypothetical protein [Prevotellaceae bacterium]